MELKIRSIGAAAQKVLAQNQELVVFSITSRGVFLRTPASASSSWILFLSAEEERGPLTLNVGKTISGCPLEPGSTLRVREHNLSSPNLIIAGGAAATWTAPLTYLNALPVPDCKDRFLAVAHHLLARRSSDLLTEMRTHFLDSHSQRHHPLIHALHALNVAAITQTLRPFYGLGKGLTPSGDDLILGFLLTLNRWGAHLYPNLDLPALNGIVIQTAVQRTTTLSANLIECAAAGQADERLIFALDGILTGEIDTEHCAAYLLSWGNSSGCDALAGMLAAFAGQS